MVRTRIGTERIPDPDSDPDSNETESTTLKEKKGIGIGRHASSLAAKKERLKKIR
jgi:hypothetical protein